MVVRRDIFLPKKEGLIFDKYFRDGGKMTDETAYRLELRRVTTLTGIRVPRVRQRIRTIYGVHANEAAGAANSSDILRGW
jgi:hypothetical protein